MRHITRFAFRLGVFGILASIVACTPVQAMATVSTGSALAPLPGVHSCAPAAPSSLASWSAAWGRIPGWQAGDGAFSVKLPDGRSMFVFGDSATTSLRGDRVWLRNTAVMYFSQLGRGSVLRKVSAETTLVPERADGSWYWSGPLVLDAGRVWEFAPRIAGGPETGFRTVGIDVAEISVPRCGTPRLVAVHESTPSSGRPESADSILWGGGAVVRDGWVYVYGTRPPDIAGWYGGRSVFVARVPSGQLADRSSWRFWSGTDWGTDESAATAAIDAQGGTEDRFSVQSVGGRTVIVSKGDGAFGNTLAEWSAESPAGPFVHRTLVANVPYTAQRHTYLGAGHDLKLANGRSLASVSLNAPMNPLSVFWTQPERFRPQWFEVGGI